MSRMINLCTSRYQLPILRKVRLTLLTFWIAVLSTTFAQPLHNAGRVSSLPYWETPKLPEIKRAIMLNSDRAHFHGRVPRLLNTTCDINCQMGRTTKPASVDQLVHELGFETLDLRSAVRVKAEMEVADIPPELLRDPLDIPALTVSTENTETTKQMASVNEKETEMLDEEYEDYYEEEEDDFMKDEKDVMGGKELHRRKRKIFGLDTRFAMGSKKYMTMYPFSAAVKLSTGCSGVLLSPKHVLTSAHCIHDGKRYVKGVKKLKVGKLMKNVQKKGRGRKKNRKKKGKKGKRRDSKKTLKTPQQQNQEDDNGNRVRRDLSLYPESILPYFKWVRARKTHIPQGWLDAAAKWKKRRINESFELPLEYDYAVIELRRALGGISMDIGISPDRNVIPSGYRIHFTGFDSDRSNNMLYRFCKIEEESPDLMYHFCDAQEGTSGSGIYIRLFDQESGTWTRKVIGVFSGHQLVKFPDGASKEYNTGVRITPLKYAQICFWTKGDYSQCRGG